MKVLFLYPMWTSESKGINKYFARTSGGTFIPYNLALLAAITERAGHHAKIIDAELERIPLDDLAKMSKEFVSNIRELYQVNDLIQATVIKAKPAIELTTSHNDDGVVYAKCDVTHEELKIVDGKLWSEELRKVVNRKISKQYGKIQV